MPSLEALQKFLGLHAKASRAIGPAKAGESAQDYGMRLWIEMARIEQEEADDADTCST